MMTTKEINWFTMDDNFGSLGFLPTEIDGESGDFICPKCGNPCTYWEGVVSQEFVTGNDIRGWSFDCFPCSITTGAEEF